MCTYFICDSADPMLLGLPTGEALGIININVDNEVTVDVTEVLADSTIPKRDAGYIDPSVPIEERPPINSKEDLRRMYPECFTLEGKYFKIFKYDIKTDPNVQPKQHPPRRVPLELKDELRKKLDDMERKGIVVKVAEPTKWVNSLVIETKGNGELRVCLDPSVLNKAVMREYHPIPVVEDIVPELNGSDLFTKLDLKDGYCHIKLTEEASDHVQYTVW